MIPVLLCAQAPQDFCKLGVVSRPRAADGADLEFWFSFSCGICKDACYCSNPGINQNLLLCGLSTSETHQKRSCIVTKYKEGFTTEQQETTIKPYEKVHDVNCCCCTRLVVPVIAFVVVGYLDRLCLQHRSQAVVLFRRVCIAKGKAGQFNG